MKLSEQHNITILKKIAGTCVTLLLMTEAISRKSSKSMNPDSWDVNTRQMR